MIDDIKIQKNVPIPPRNSINSGISALFRKMNIGDSVVLPLTARANLSSYAKNCAIKVTSRKIGNSIRVWRIK